MQSAISSPPPIDINEPALQISIRPSAILTLQFG
jgi:hypothetical protein